MLRALQSPLRYWHLLSLDAPTVAALWCWAFGRAARLHLAGWLPLALGLGTWLFYVADRLLDARFGVPAQLEERHRFHACHRRVFLAVAVPVAATLAVLIAHMPLSLIEGYCALGGLSLLYLALVHLPVITRGHALRRFPKELAVALLFAVATALPAWDAALRRDAGTPRHHPLLLLCPLFAALCWLNCMAIDKWEQHPHDDRSQRVERFALLILTASGFSLFALFNHAARGLAMAAAVSALSLLALDRSHMGGRMAAAARRIAADVALLTPVLLPLAGRLGR